MPCLCVFFGMSRAMRFVVRSRQFASGHPVGRGICSRFRWLKRSALVVVKGRQAAIGQARLAQLLPDALMHTRWIHTAA